MRIDSTKLMYWAFAYGRTSMPPTEILLPVLPAVVDIVQQTGTFVLSLPEEIRLILPADIRKQVRISWLRSRGQNHRLTTENAPIFALACAGIHDLRRLWGRNERAATRSLCYAFHNLPRFLRRPELFDRKMYEHCVLIAGKHWTLLSPALQEQLSVVMGWTHAQTVAFLVAQATPPAGSAP